MKKTIFNFSVFLACVVSVFTSCRNEDEIRFPDFAKGVSMRSWIEPTKSSFNSADLSNSSILLNFHSYYPEEIKSVAVRVIYVDSQRGKDSRNMPIPDTIYAEKTLTLLESKLSKDRTKPSTLVVSPSELETLINPKVGFGPGDFFIFKFTVTKTDGTVLSESNVSPGINAANGTTSFTTKLLNPVYVACPSVMKVGNYSGTAVDVPQSEPVATIDDVVVTKVGVEPFRFRVSAWDASWWNELAIRYNLGTKPAESIPAEFFELCTTILSQNANSGGYGTHAAEGGKWDEATNSFTMQTYNEFNDIYLISEFVKK